MSVRRMAALRAHCCVLRAQRSAPGMGKIGVLVAMTGGDEAFGKQVAMHIAAANPASLSEAILTQRLSRREKQVQMDIARESGKPEQ